MSLLEFLDLRQTNCLNEHIEHNIQQLLSTKKRNTSDAFLQSDADEQLLINIVVRRSTFADTTQCRLQL